MATVGSRGIWLHHRGHKNPHKCPELVDSDVISAVIAEMNIVLKHHPLPVSKNHGITNTSMCHFCTAIQYGMPSR